MASESSGVGWRPPERVVPHGTWTRERVLFALRDWAREFSEAPRQHEWAIAHAREAGLESGRLRRWMAEYPRWPSSETVVKRFGSWSAGLETAGLREERMAPWELSLPERVATARRLVAEGVPLVEIARLVRVDPATVRRYLRASSCPGCGGPVVSPRGRHCTSCAPKLRPQRWSREALISALRAWAEEHGRPPSTQDWLPSVDRTRQWARQYPRWPSTTQVQRVFGSWGAALDASGYPVERWDRETVLAALRELARQEGRPPMHSDLRPKRAGVPSHDVVTARFGSFTAALCAAGFQPRTRYWSRDQVIRALGRWAAGHGRSPTYDDWKRAGEDHPTAGVVAKLFGSWSSGLLAAGLPIKQRPWDRAAIIEALQAWATEHERVPSTTDWAGADPSGRRPAHLRVLREFGTWHAGLRAAGFDARARRWTRGEVIDALRAWAVQHGRAPVVADWQHASAEHPSPQTAARLFGSWPDALLTSGLSIKRRHRWQRQEILHAIQEWTVEHGRTPKRADWYRREPHGRHPSTGTVHHNFGSWNAALQAAQAAPAATQSSDRPAPRATNSRPMPPARPRSRPGR